MGENGPKGRGRVGKFWLHLKNRLNFGPVKVKKLLCGILRTPAPPYGIRFCTFSQNYSQTRLSFSENNVNTGNRLTGNVAHNCVKEGLKSQLWEQCPQDIASKGPANT